MNVTPVMSTISVVGRPLDRLVQRLAQDRGRVEVGLAA